MSLDAVLLSRIQFAFTMGYHILWPAWTIGISGFIVILLFGTQAMETPVRLRAIYRNR